MLSNYTTSTYLFHSHPNVGALFHKEKKFFKKLLYFTIFYFHFASVYGIIFANLQNFFSKRSKVCRKR